MTTFVWCRGRAARGTRRRQDLQEMLQTPGGTYSKARGIPLRAARPTPKDDLSWKETRQTLISPPSRHREWIKPAPCQQRAFGDVRVCFRAIQLSSLQAGSSFSEVLEPWQSAALQELPDILHWRVTAPLPIAVREPQYKMKRF